jgi:hypothetical protein
VIGRFAVAALAVLPIAAAAMGVCESRTEYDALYDSMKPPG